MIVALPSPGAVPFHASSEQLLGAAGITAVPTDLVPEDDDVSTVQVRVLATMRSTVSSVVVGLARFLPDGTFRTLVQVAYTGARWATKATPWATVQRPGDLTTLRVVGRSLATTTGDVVALAAEFRAGAGTARK